MKQEYFTSPQIGGAIILSEDQWRGKKRSLDLTLQSTVWSRDKKRCSKKFPYFMVELFVHIHEENPGRFRQACVCKG